MNDDLDLVLIRFLYHSLGLEEYDEPFEYIREEFSDVQSRRSVGHTRYLRPAVRTFTGDESNLTEEDVERYDRNIRSYLDELNEHRDDRLELRYYQYVAVFFTEVYFDMLSADKESLRLRFNEYIESEFVGSSQSPFTVQDSTVLHKIAYWMATGSGKTYIAHLNYHQFDHYLGFDSVKNVILVAPKEQIARQHVEEFGENGLDASRINDGTDADILVTDFGKLKDKTGEKIIDVSKFRGDNLVFVDEGHKGLGSVETSLNKTGWKEIREELVGDGFTIEYSATYGAAIQTVSGYQEYGRSIIFDYPYGRFHTDGYGKDYNILNISTDDRSTKYWQKKRDEWLLLNMLAYYEKLRLYEDNQSLVDEYNIDKPLSVFVGDRVTTARNEDEQTDVELLVSFLARVINDREWVVSFIQDVLRYETEFQTEMNLFDSSFTSIQDEPAENVYDDLLERVFDSSGSTIEAQQLNNDDGEIGLKASDATEYFGLVTIGDDSEFMELMGSLPNVQTTELDTYTGRLFEKIDDNDSPVRLLVGSRKFAEGWDSTRPVNMGLLNLGRSKGPATVQMFGRGVRVDGQESDGKREQHPTPDVELLQSLHVFGLRADYIEDFKESLQGERVNTETTQIEIDVETDDKFAADETYLRPVTEVETTSEIPIVRFQDRVDDVRNPRIEIGYGVQGVSKSDGELIQESYDTHIKELTLTEDLRFNEEPVHLDVLDWNTIYHDVLEETEHNVVIERGDIRSAVEAGEYRLFARPELLDLNSLDERSDVEDICTKVGVKLADRIHHETVREIEEEHVTLEPVTDDWVDEVTPDFFQMSIEESDRIGQEVVDEIQDIDSIDELKERQHASELLLVLAKHHYKPIAVSSENNDTRTVDYLDDVHPEGINEGEKMFLRSLDSHDLVENYDEIQSVVALRNPANTGIGFDSAGGYYPDFILWVQTDDVQHVIFADPKGMMHVSDEKLKKVRFGEEIGGLIDRDGVQLHSYIIARADRTRSGNVRQVDKIINKWERNLDGYDGEGIERLKNANIYIQNTEEDGTVQEIMFDVLQ